MIRNKMSLNERSDIQFEKVVLHRAALPNEGLSNSRRVIVYMIYDFIHINMRIVYEFTNAVYTHEKCVKYGMQNMNTDVMTSERLTASIVSESFSKKLNSNQTLETSWMSEQIGAQKLGSGTSSSSIITISSSSSSCCKTHKIIPVYRIRSITCSSSSMGFKDRFFQMKKMKPRIQAGLSKTMQPDARYIAKVSAPYLDEVDRYQYQMEFYIYKCAAKLNIAPKVATLIFETSCDEKQAILVMERWMSMSLYVSAFGPLGMALPYSASLEIINNIQKMHREGILHCDLYLRNIVTHKMSVFSSREFSLEKGDRHGIRKFGIIDYGCAFVLPKGFPVTDPYLRAIDYVSIFYGAWCESKKTTVDNIPELITFKDYLNIPAHVWDKVFSWRVYDGNPTPIGSIVRSETIEAPARFDHMYMYIFRYFVKNHYTVFFDFFPTAAHFYNRCSWIYRLSPYRRDRFTAYVSKVYDEANAHQQQRQR